jgi:hypothetical protein
MPNFCNCPQSWEAAGQPLPEKVLANNGAGSHHEVEVNKDKTCVHCGYASVFAHKHPDDYNWKLMNQRVAEIRKNIREIKPENGWIKSFEKGRTVYKRQRMHG